MKGIFKVFCVIGIGAFPATGFLIPTVYAQNTELSVGENNVPEISEAELKRRQIAETIEQYRNALFDDPQNGELHWKLAQQYILSGSADIAENELLRAVALGVPKQSIMVDLGKVYLVRKKYDQIIDEIVPEEALFDDLGEVYLILGQAYNETGDIPQAFDFYRKASNLVEDRFELNASLAEIYYMLGEYDIAEENVDKALKIEGRDPKTLILKGDLVHRKKGAEHSYTYYEQAVFYDPDNIRAQLKLAGTLYNLRYDDDAMKHINRALRIEKNNTLANFIAASISARRNNVRMALNYLNNTGEELESFVPGLILKGKLYYSTKTYQSAEASLSKAVLLEPDNIDARRLLGASLLYQNKNNQAVAILEPIIDNDLKRNADILLLGNAYIKSGEYNKGVLLIEEATKDDRGQISEEEKRHIEQFSSGDAYGVDLNVENITNLNASSEQRLIFNAYQALNDGDYDTVFENAETLTEIDRNNPVGFNLLGLAYLEQKKFEEAQSNFRRAITIDRNFHLARLNMSKLDLELGRRNEAVNNLNNILSTDESYFPAYEALSNIAMADGDLIEAGQYLMAGLNASPKSLEAYERVAQFFFDTNNIGEASKIAGQLSDTFPEHALTYKINGKIQLMAGNNRQAIENFEQSVSYNNQDEETYLLLSDAYMKNDEVFKIRPLLKNGLLQVRNTQPLIRELILLSLKDGNFADSYKYTAQLKLEEDTKAAGYFYEAELKLAENNMEDAVKAYEAAGKVGGNRGLVVSSIAEVYTKNGQANKAVEVRYNYAVELNNTGDVDQAIQELESIISFAPQNTTDQENLSKARELLSSLR